MLGNGVSTGDRRKFPWKPWLKVSALALGFCLLIGAVIYVSVRARTLYAMYAQLLTLQAEVSDMEARHAAVMINASARLDDIEVVLFGDVLARLNQPQQKPPAPQFTADARWQANRDQSFRDRIAQLERARLDLEVRIQRLERELTGISIRKGIGR